MEAGFSASYSFIENYSSPAICHLFYQVVVVFWKRNELNIFPHSSVLGCQFLVLHWLGAGTHPHVSVVLTSQLQASDSVSACSAPGHPAPILLW